MNKKKNEKPNISLFRIKLTFAKNVWQWKKKNYIYFLTFSSSEGKKHQLSYENVSFAFLKLQNSTKQYPVRRSWPRTLIQ